MSKMRERGDWRRSVEGMRHHARRLEYLVCEQSTRDAAALEEIDDAILWNQTGLSEAASAVPESIRTRHPAIDWETLSHGVSGDRCNLTPEYLDTLQLELKTVLQREGVSPANAEMQSARTIRGPRRDAVLEILRTHLPEIEAAQVRELLLFGSVARDEAGPASDVDLLVEFAEPVGLIALNRLQIEFEKMLGRPVDLVVRRDLDQEMLTCILQEAIPVA